MPDIIDLVLGESAAYTATIWGGQRRQLFTTPVLEEALGLVLVFLV